MGSSHRHRVRAVTKFVTELNEVNGGWGALIHSDSCHRITVATGSIALTK